MPEEAEPILTESRGPIRLITLHRPQYRNAQNSAMTYALDRAFHNAAMDDEIAVIVLRGSGDHFSAGHDIGSPGRDVDVSFPKVTMWPDHVGKPGIEGRLYRESEIYFELCRRWRDIRKPTIAMVQGACVAGGLMLARTCDLIIAADDSFYSDPVLRMGAPGVEYFAHPWQMGPRFAKEFLFLGQKVDATRARELGMVNRVVPRSELEAVTLEIAQQISHMPRMALTLTKKAVNFAEEAMGLRAGMDHSFALHQLAHASSAEITGGNAILGATPESLKAAAEQAGKRG